MNRRTFTAAVTAGLVALPATSVDAQRNRAASSLIISDTTGAEIDLSQSSFTVETHRVSDFDDYVFEVLRLESHLGLIILRFISGAGRYEFSEAYRIYRSYLEDEMEDEFEELGSERVDGGGWMAFRLPPDLNSYHEVQQEAFPEANLWIEAQLPHDHYAVAMEDVQAIDLAGMPLFLFLEDNDALGNLFPTVSTKTDIGRLAVPDRTSSSRPGSDPGASSANDGDDAVQTVRTHQAQFMDELDTFYGIVDALIDEDSTSESELTLFTDLMDLMLGWLLYPDDASAQVFPPELSSLESAYFEWSDSVGEMGATMSAWMLGDGEINAFLDAIDVTVQLNSVLSAELRTLGIVIKPIGQGFARPNDQISDVLKRHETSILAA